MFVDNADARAASLRVPDSAGLGWGPGKLCLRISPGDLAAGISGNTPRGTGPTLPPPPQRRPGPGDPQRHLLILLNSHSDPGTGLPLRPHAAAGRLRQSTKALGVPPSPRGPSGLTQNQVPGGPAPGAPPLSVGPVALWPGQLITAAQ